MKNVVKIEDMKVFSVSEVSNLFGIDIVENGVYKIRSEDRGDVVSVESVEVVDGMFEVESKEELISDMMEEFEIFVDGDSNKWKMIGEYKEELVEYVYSEMNSEYDGVYSIGLSEDEGIDIVRVGK
jgi:hypothetical protein